MLTANPARLLGLGSGRLARGAPADLVLIDLERPWAVEPERLRSKSKNTPFDSWTCRGVNAATIVAGRTLYTNPDVSGAAAFA